MVLAETLNVMIVDDTATYRAILSKVLESMPDVTIAATAPNGKIALDKLASTPIDLVLLDIEMPEMDGLQCLRLIRHRHPQIGVVMVSGMNRSSADITIQALESGALDFIPKPEGASLAQSSEALSEKLYLVFKHFQNKRFIRRNFERKPSRLPSPVPPSLEPPPGIGSPPRIIPVTPAPYHSGHSDVISHAWGGATCGKIDVIGIGVSTGGPNALIEVIPHLPGDLGVPILLVQHMPPVFTASLANSLAKKSKINVKEAEEGEKVLPNTVYIAPGGRHMTVYRKTGGTPIIRLNDDPPENSCRPAVDVLFRSIAEVYGKNVLSVIMTGMGSDGTKGVQTLKQAGCYSITQSEKTCVVYGMPRTAVEKKVSDEVVDLNHIATRITELVMRQSKK